ncbi:MAG: FAD binding domain-containing protein [Actinobacteria bacterium]|nr:FAD binding domain-containing protein [Actinomycetota bacterium]
MKLLQPSSLEELDAAGPGLLLAGGTDVVPILRNKLIDVDTLVDIRAVVPRGVDGTRIGAGTTLAELEVDPQIPAALREACASAASPQLRAMGTIGGNLRQATRCWYWRMHYPCFLHGGDRCYAQTGVHREHSVFANDRTASAHPSDPAAALLALNARVRTNRRELSISELYRLPTNDNRDVVALDYDEVILDLEVPTPEASTYLKAMDRQKYAFALVGVAAARFGTDVRLGLSGVAPIPWALDSAAGLDDATPLPDNAYKIQIARALIERALEAVG